MSMDGGWRMEEFVLGGCLFELVEVLRSAAVQLGGRR